MLKYAPPLVAMSDDFTKQSEDMKITITIR
jgi:hypothetical protein